MFAVPELINLRDDAPSRETLPPTDKIPYVGFVFAPTVNAPPLVTDKSFVTLSADEPPTYKVVAVTFPPVCVYEARDLARPVASASPILVTVKLALSTTSFALPPSEVIVESLAVVFSFTVIVPVDTNLPPILSVLMCV